MNIKGKVAGKKFSRRHTTTSSKESELVCRIAAKIGGVKKIVPGMIKTGLHTKIPKIKFMYLQGGVIAKVVSNVTAQDVRIYVEGDAKGVVIEIIKSLEKLKLHLKIINQVV